jgi:CspA family cold shock protein
MIRDFINKLFKSNKDNASKEGTVKFFNTKKGFGFIILKGSDEEIFVHSKGLIDKIRDNKKVTFTIEKSDKGPVAVNVRLAKS